MTDALIYDLKYPVTYKKNTDTGEETECKGIGFARPRGSDADKIYPILGALKPLVDGGELPADIATKTCQFVREFGTIVGDPNFPIDGVANLLDSRDILPLAGFCVENFI